jgi:hypothetical protein
MIDQRIIPDFREPHEGYTNASLRKMVRELRAENRQLRESLNLLIGYALTTRSDSTAWLEGLAFRINQAADVLGDTDRAVADGDHLIVRKAAS